MPGPSPVPQGSPDWSRLSPWADQVIINDSLVAIVAPFTYNGIYVGNVQALQMTTFGSTDKMRTTLKWFSDPALSHLVRSRPVDSGSGQQLTMSFRPFAPYLTVTVQGPGAGALTYSLVLATMASVEQTKFNLDEIALASLISQPIGAGATVTTDCTASHVGEGYWQAFSSATSWDARIESLDISSTPTVVAKASNSFNATPAHVYLPGGHLRVIMHNSAAGAATYDLICTARPNTHQ